MTQYGCNPFYRVVDNLISMPKFGSNTIKNKEFIQNQNIDALDEEHTEEVLHFSRSKKSLGAKS